MRALRALSGRRAGVVALVCYAVVVFFCATWPLEFRLGPDALRAKWAETEWEVFYRDESGHVIVDSDLILNIFFFMPLGGAWALMRRPRSPFRAAGEALLVGAALSVFVEGLQVLTPSRTTQLADVWRNTLGAGLGGGLGQQVLSALERRLGPDPRDAGTSGGDGGR